MTQKTTRRFGIGGLITAIATCFSFFSGSVPKTLANDTFWAGNSSPQSSRLSAEEECQRISAPYKRALAQYGRRARVYWQKIEQKKDVRKRKKRRQIAIARKDYVLTHPPAYQGPKRPKCLDEIKKRPTKPRAKIGVVADFLRAAKREYNFVPRATDEKGYKRAYAMEAIAVGLTEDQVVGVYALETGGIGPYYRQSGIFPIDYECRPIKPPKGRAASSALGYAQLLGANSAAVLVENGAVFAKRLEFESLMVEPARQSELRAKAQLLRRMIGDIKRGIAKYKNRNNWREYVAFSKTSKGYAVHALNLDADVGPMLQVHKLKKITTVAASKGFAPVSGAELELMNLVGYGRGLEMMTPVARGVPTSNFFTRKGYERNPVAKNLSAQGLLDKLGTIIEKRRKNCGAVEFTAIFQDVAKGQR